MMLTVNLARTSYTTALDLRHRTLPDETTSNPFCVETIGLMCGVGHSLVPSWGHVRVAS